MSILNAIYKVKTNDGFDSYHLQTNAKMVQVLDQNDSLVGDLETLLLKGKKVTSGDIKNIKTFGLHQVTNVDGLPSGLDKAKTYLLEVTTLGDDIKNPSMVHYSLINSDGSIYSRTISGTSDSGWSSGGTSAKKAMEEIQRLLGDNSALNTNSKEVIGAINELNSKLNSNNESLENLGGHNHDTRYIRKDANSDLNATVNILNGHGLNIRNASLGNINLIKSDTNRNITLGNTTSELKIESKGSITRNGRKVWDEDNDGKGSGLDADRVHGVSGDKVAFLEGAQQTFTTTPKFDRGIDLSDSASIKWGDVSMQASKVGEDVMVSFNRKGIPFVRFGSVSGLNLNGLELLNREGPTTLKLKGADGDFGMGFNIRPSDGEFQFNNYQNGSRLFSVPKRGNYMVFDNFIEVQGKRIYMQDTEPRGDDIPDGSIWIN